MTKVGNIINVPIVGTPPEPASGHVTVYAEGGVFKSILADGRVANSEQMLPCHASLFADEAEFVPGLGVGGLTVQANSSVPFQLWAFQSSTPSVGDKLVWKPLLQAGTYRLRTFATSASAYGITQTRINGVTVATDDWYASPSVTPDVREHTGIVVPSNGIHDVELYVSGKNASSSNFFFVFTAFFLTRTGA